MITTLAENAEGLYAYMKTLPKEKKEEIEAAMAKYPDNKWWESGDLAESCYYQLKEPLVLVDYSLFHSGLEALLGRPVMNAEIAINHEGLVHETESALARRKKKLGVSPEEVETNYNKFIPMLVEFCRRVGVKLLTVTKSEDKGPIDTSGYDPRFKP